MVFLLVFIVIVLATFSESLYDLHLIEVHPLISCDSSSHLPSVALAVSLSTTHHIPASRLSPSTSSSLSPAVRMSVIAHRRRKANHTGSQPPPTPRFSQVARDMSRNWFGDTPMPAPAASSSAGAAGRYDYGISTSHPNERWGSEVVRDDPERGDPELPSYCEGFPSILTLHSA